MEIESVAPDVLRLSVMPFDTINVYVLGDVLVAGDDVAGSVLATPGHTPGHIAFWRERDRILTAPEPAVVLFGHGPPLRDPTRFAAFVAALPKS